MVFLHNAAPCDKPVHVNAYIRYRCDRLEYVRDHYRRLPHQYDWVDNILI